MPARSQGSSLGDTADRTIASAEPAGDAEGITRGVGIDHQSAAIGLSDVSDLGPCSASPLADESSPYTENVVILEDSSDEESVLDVDAAISLPDTAIYADANGPAEPTENADLIFDSFEVDTTALRDQHISAQMAAEAWPHFLSAHAIANESGEVAEMQEFKARCFELIRWRSLGPSNKDPLIENVLTMMRGEIRGLGAPLKSSLWKLAGNMGEGIDGIHALEALGEAFLKSMNQRALGVTLWRDDAAMLQSKASFLSHLPGIAQLKSGKAIETLEERLQALIGMIKKHSGEVVAVAGEGNESRSGSCGRPTSR